MERPSPAQVRRSPQSSRVKTGLISSMKVGMILSVCVWVGGWVGRGELESLPLY